MLVVGVVWLVVGVVGQGTVSRSRSVSQAGLAIPSMVGSDTLGSLCSVWHLSMGGLVTPESCRALVDVE